MDAHAADGATERNMAASRTDTSGDRNGHGKISCQPFTSIYLHHKPPQRLDGRKSRDDIQADHHHMFEQTWAGLNIVWNP